MLLGILAAIGLVHMLAGKGLIRADEGTIKEEKKFNAG